MSPREAVLAEFIFCHVIGPLQECTLGVFHDITLMHQGDFLALVLNCPENGGARDALAAFLGDGFQADANIFFKWDLLVALWEFLLKKR